MNRNLDGIYFRINRDGRWQNICYSDLTKEEQDKVCEGRGREWLRSVADILADRLKEIGDQFDIVAGDEDEYDE